MRILLALIVSVFALLGALARLGPDAGVGALTESPGCCCASGACRCPTCSDHHPGAPSTPAAAASCVLRGGCPAPAIPPAPTDPGRAFLAPVALSLDAPDPASRPLADGARARPISALLDLEAPVPKRAARHPA